jgi:hypothetical protein
MNSQTQRRIVVDPVPKAEPVVAPLSGPSYGAYSVARRRWRKPIPGIIADAIANSRAVIARLERGMHMPDLEGQAHYKDVFDTLLERTRQQLSALEDFSQIGWSEYWVERIMSEKPKSASDPLFYGASQPQIVKLTQAQQARADQIALAGRARLAALSARLEAVRHKPEPEPEPEADAQGPAVRPALPAIIPPQPPPATWSDLLAVMNNQHAIIDNVGGKTVIASWEPSSLDPTRRRWVFQNKESFLLRYSNRYATIEITTKRGGTVQTPVPLSGWWLTHRHRQQYRGITFQPDAPRSSMNASTSGKTGAAKRRRATGL